MEDGSFLKQNSFWFWKLVKDNHYPFQFQNFKSEFHSKMALMPLFSAHDWITLVANTKQKPIQQNHSFGKFMIFREFQNSSLVQLLVYSTPVNAMNEQSEDKCDRELFSELLEPPIHPLLIHIVPPFIEENNPVFTLQMNGEAAWRLKEIYWPPQKVFELFQTSIM